jgi:hypothetical protein
VPRIPATARPRQASGHSLIGRLREPAVYRALAIFAIAAFPNAAILLHQVSIIEATGISFAAASGYAGVRGACQLPGRFLLSPLARLLKLRSLLAACYAVAATGTVALLLALNLNVLRWDW